MEPLGSQRVGNFAGARLEAEGAAGGFDEATRNLKGARDGGA